MTDEGGFYRLPQLAPGVYSLTASSSGFSNLLRSGVVVRVNDRLRIDLVLQVGGVSEQVTVQAPTPLLQTEDATAGQVIDNQRITELPLNGRTWLQLATLTPATVSYPGVSVRGVGNIGFSLGGSRTNQINYLINGFNNNFFVSGAGAVVHPPVDSLQEFKVQTNNYTADTGRLAGSVVNATIKSGSNALHGTAYEFLRNRELNARNFFAPPGGRKPQFTRNQFGASTGGPFVRNKLFFFLNYEGNRQRQDQVTTRQVFTAAHKAGDFSSELGPQVGTDALGRPVRRGQVFDPFSVRRLADGTALRDPFPGNVIPAARLNPVSKALIDLTPPPNTTGTPNFVRNLGNPVNIDTFVGRIDWVASEKDNLSSHFVYTDSDSFTAPVLGLPLDGGNAQNSVLSNQRQFGLGWTRIFSPTNLNEFRAGYVRDSNRRKGEQANEPLNARFGIPIAMQGPETGGLAALQITGFTQLGTTAGSPFFQFANIYEVSDSFTSIRGAHTFKFGARGALKLFQNQKNCNNCRGVLQFNGVFTRQPGFGTSGSPVADFLMGTANTANLGSLTNEKDVGRDIDWFVQDKWRASSKLTVTLGLRYQYNPPGWEARDMISSVVFGQNFSNPEVVVPKGQAENVFQSMRDVYFPFIPVRRATELDRGLVRNRKGNFAPRLGIAYQLSPKLVLRTGYGIFFGFPDVVAGAVLTVNPPSKLLIGDASNTVDPTLLINRSIFGPDPFTRALRNPDFFSIRNVNLPPEFTQMYNLSIQYEFAPNWLVEVGYQGNRVSRALIVNQINDAAPALPSDTSTPQSRRRVSSRLGNLPYLTPEGFSHFNALTLSVEKRFSQGMSVLANYTWSRALGVAPPVTLGINNAPIQNPLDLSREYAPLEFDVINRVSLSYIYDLPFGKDRPFLSAAPAVWNHILGGWQINGILTLQGGFPITPTLNASLGKTFTNSRPNAVGDPKKTSRRPDDWISRDAFAVPSNAEIAAGNFFGNIGRNSLREPGLANLDFSLSKNFALRESLTLQFRTEVFNLTNTPFFGIPGGVGTNFNTPTFGKATLAGDPRVVQFGLKLIF